MHVYASLQLEDDEDGMWSDLQKKASINNFANPLPGEVLLTLPAVKSKQWGRFVRARYNPNLHAAFVTLVSEADRALVTLENWAVNDIHAVNRNWGWCVYGNDFSGKKLLQKSTYHQTLTASGGHGYVSMTVVCVLPE